MFQIDDVPDIVKSSKAKIEEGIDEYTIEREIVSDNLSVFELQKIMSYEDRLCFRYLTDNSGKKFYLMKKFINSYGFSLHFFTIPWSRRL